MKTAGVDESILKFTGPAKVYESQDDAVSAILTGKGFAVERVKKVLEGRPHIVDVMKNGGVQLVFNTTEGKQSISDSFDIRRTALMGKIPYFTTAAGAHAAAQAMAAEGELEVRPLQSYA